MRNVTTIAVALGTFVAGSALGFFASREFYRTKLTSYELANIDHMATYVMVQHFQGTPQAYEASLKDLLVALEERERAGPGPLSSGQIIAVDRALTYIRLALLATEHGDPDAAAKYRARAEALCPLAGWKSCSWDELTKIVQGLDTHSVWDSSQAGTNHGS